MNLLSRLLRRLASLLRLLPLPVVLCIATPAATTALTTLIIPTPVALLPALAVAALSTAVVLGAAGMVSDLRVVVLAGLATEAYGSLDLFDGVLDGLVDTVPLGCLFEEVFALHQTRVPRELRLTLDLLELALHSEGVAKRHQALAHIL